MTNYEKAAKSLGITTEELDRKVEKFIHHEMVVSHQKPCLVRRAKVQRKLSAT